MNQEIADKIMEGKELSFLEECDLMRYHFRDYTQNDLIATALAYLLGSTGKMTIEKSVLQELLLKSTNKGK